MDDLISRQAAIDALKKDMASLDHIIKGISANDVRLDAYVSQRNQVNYDIYTINNLPSIQPERLTDDDFETIRIHLNAHKENLCNQQRWEEAEEYQRIIDRFMAFASAQPNHNADVSKMGIIHCKDCKFARMTVNGECKYCDIWFPDEKTYMPGDYYCASAERRDEA